MTSDTGAIDPRWAAVDRTPNPTTQHVATAGDKATPIDRAAQAATSATGRSDPRFVQVTSLAHAEALRKAHESKIAAEAAVAAVAAERARAAQAVREIVEGQRAEMLAERDQNMKLVRQGYVLLAELCLAAVEAQR